MTSHARLRRLWLTAGLGAVLGLAAPLASTAVAQDAPSLDAELGPHARGRHHRRRGHRRAMMRQMMGRLGVTDAQRAEIREIRQSSRERARGLRQGGDRSALRAHRRAVRERIFAVLTPEQRERAEGLRALHGQRRIARRVERMTERLALSPPQVQQVRGVLRHAHSQRRAIREASRLDGTWPREAIRALRTRTRDQMRTILTDAQEAQLREMRRHGRGRRGF